MQIATASLSFEGAALSMRERFALNGPALNDAVRDLAGSLRPVAREVALVSTCNRTELYTAGPQGAPTADAVRRWLASRFGVDAADIDAHWRLEQDRQAVRHLFRVASGLESMVLGEPQILGQVKGAARVAHEAGALGTHLHKLFQRSFSVAKAVRAHTALGAHAVSMGSVAVGLAERVFGPLSESRVLFVGSGEMIALSARHFHQRAPRELVIASRNAGRSGELAAGLGGRAIPLNGLEHALAQFDVVVSCTASELPVIGLGAVREAIRARRRRPMVLIDLAVPRDIEQAVGELDDVFLYTVDDLGRLLESGRAGRRQAVAEADRIVAEHTENYMRWLDERASVPAIRDLHARAERIKRRELERALRGLRRGADPAAVLTGLADALSAKFAHGPTVALREGSALPADAEALVERLLPAGR